jgi:hypothetical protein
MAYNRKTGTKNMINVKAITFGLGYAMMNVKIP